MWRGNRAWRALNPRPALTFRARLRMVNNGHFPQHEPGHMLLDQNRDGDSLTEEADGVACRIGGYIVHSKKLYSKEFYTGSP